MVKDEPAAIEKALLPPEIAILEKIEYALPAATVPLPVVVIAVAVVTPATSLAAAIRLTTSPTTKVVLNEVPVPVTAVVVRAIVPVPVTAPIEDEKVTAQLLVISNFPMVSLDGTLVTVAVAAPVATISALPSNTRISFAAPPGGRVAGDQLLAASKSPEATFQV